MLRCLNIAVTNAACEKKGQTAKVGGKQFTLDEFLAIYTEFLNTPATTWGVYEDFIECLKLYDKDQNGKLQLAELSTVMVNMGKKYKNNWIINNFIYFIQFKAEKITKAQVEEVLGATKTVENDDGEIEYGGKIYCYIQCICRVLVILF